MSQRAGPVMLHFSESYAGGWFGFGRTYGAVARFSSDPVVNLDAEWPEALAATAQWRARRKERATALHLDFEIPRNHVWEAIAFVKAKLLVPADDLCPELRGLLLNVHVYTADADSLLFVQLFPEATTVSAPAIRP